MDALILVDKAVEVNGFEPIGTFCTSCVYEATPEFEEYLQANKIAHRRTSRFRIESAMNIEIPDKFSAAITAPKSKWKA